MFKWQITEAEREKDEVEGTKLHFQRYLYSYISLPDPNRQVRQNYSKQVFSPSSSHEPEINTHATGRQIFVSTLYTVSHPQTPAWPTPQEAT